MKSPDIKQNPHPTKRFELIVTVDDAPGSFDKVEAGVLFQVRNVDCVPNHPFTGGRDVPSTVRDFTLTRVDDRTWKGYFFKDLLQDEDYFGRGVCHWDVMSVGPDFQKHGMSFNPGLSLWNEPTQERETRYFKKKMYLDSSLTNANAGSADSWPSDSEDVRKHPDAFFPVTVAIKEAQP
jgi:hypothetical protein